MVEITHAIIAGTNKAGTTSLFRYLSDHPDVCPSRIKELDFFKRELNGSAEEALASYLACFPGCREYSSVRLESTPAYLSGGRRVAARIHRIVPDAKLIFVLREPVSRLLSFFFQNRQTKFNAGVAELSLEDFASLVEKVADLEQGVSEPGPTANAYIQFQKGCYARYIAEYMECFSSENILIVFFDELVSQTSRCVTRIAASLEIDPNFFDGYRFHAENKTRRYKHSGLHKISSRINRLLEPQLNRYPAVRHTVRKIYLSMNEKAGSRDAVPDSTRQRLELLYKPHNAALARLLDQTFPQMESPAWIADCSTTAPARNRTRVSIS